MTTLHSAEIEFPTGITSAQKPYPVYYLDTTRLNLRDTKHHSLAAAALYDMLCLAYTGRIAGQSLVKVHIGEPRCTTRMRPEFTPPVADFLKYRGAAGIVAGDTTVAYTGMRGHKQNPSEDVSSYMKLAHRHGWSASGPAGIPFVVLDRPCSAISGVFEFSDEQILRKVGGIERYRDFYLAGGYAASDFIVNTAHLTLHGLAGLAGCVKAIAMGCAGLTGKLRMHQFLLPVFDAKLCTRCGICVSNCPENAIGLTDTDAPPQVAEGICIGCGECVSLCPVKAVQLFGKEIEDWSRGEETLPRRMADYTIGLMNGFWERSLHILSLYSITELCDCVDKVQKPFVNDMGLLIGRNPFAVDLAGALLLEKNLEPKTLGKMKKKIDTAVSIARYVQNRYGIISQVPLHTVAG